MPPPFIFCLSQSGVHHRIAANVVHYRKNNQNHITKINYAYAIQKQKWKNIVDRSARSKQNSASSLLRNTAATRKRKKMQRTTTASMLPALPLLLGRGTKKRQVGESMINKILSGGYGYGVLNRTRPAMNERHRFKERSPDTACTFLPNYLNDLSISYHRQAAIKQPYGTPCNTEPPPQLLPHFRWVFLNCWCGFYLKFRYFFFSWRKFKKNTPENKRSQQPLTPLRHPLHIRRPIWAALHCTRLRTTLLDEHDMLSICARAKPDGLSTIDVQPEQTQHLHGSCFPTALT